MRYAILGNQGSGKNTFLSRLAYLEYESNPKKEVWSNFQLDLPNYRELEVMDVFDLKPNILVFIDEAYAWLESRNSTSIINQVLTHIIFQSRKRQFDLFLSAQMFGSLDLRFRNQADTIVRCLNRNEYDDFTYRVSTKGVRKSNCFTLPYNTAEKKYFPIFNTFEIIESHRIDDLKFKLLENYPDRLYPKVKEIAKEIEPILKKITRDEVKRALLNCGYVRGYEKYVYPELKGLTSE